MAESNELRLKINAAAAKAGAKEFVGAIASIKRAVTDLDSKTQGAFDNIGGDSSKLRATTKETERLTGVSRTAADQIKKMALASASAMRVSQNEAHRLSERFQHLGDTAALERVNQQLDQLRVKLTAAQSPLDIRDARSAFADTSAELKRYANDLDAAGRAERRAADDQRAHAASIDSLRAKYNPLYAASKQYEAALEEINRAEKDGILSSQLATDARDREAAKLGTASAAADQYASNMQRANRSTMQGVAVGYQLQDVLITSQMGFQSVGMIALQQGSQLSSTLALMKGQGSIFKGLAAGFASLVSPLSLITIGAVAAGAAILKWFFAAGEETQSFADSLGDANSAISNLRSATDALAVGNVRNLRSEYGAVNEELRIHLERLRQVAQYDALSATKNLVGSAQGELTSDGNPFTTDVDAVRRAFDTTNDRARSLLATMNEIGNARTFDEQVESVTALRKTVESMTGGLGQAEGPARALLVQLIKSEDAALKLKAAQDGTTSATHAASGAASGLTYTIGTAADEAARLLANLNSVPGALAVMGKSVEQQIAGIRAQNRSLNLQIGEGLSALAANRRVQLQDVVNAAKTGGPVNFDQIAKQYGQIEELETAAKEQERLRKVLSDKTRPARSGGGGGGGSRKAALTEERQAIEDVNKTIQDRLSALDAEYLALQLAASGAAKTTEGADLMAKAMIAGGGALDSQTAAMIRQLETAKELTDQLRELSKRPVQDFIDTVPSMVEAGNLIEEGVIGNLRDGFRDLMTGEFSPEAFGQALLGTFAEVMADQATKEFLELFNLDETGLGIGKLLSGNDMAGGANVAGQTIATSMITAGQTVAGTIGAAMTGGSTQLSGTISTSGTVAATQMNQQIQAGGSVAANNMGQSIAAAGGGGGSGGLFGMGGGFSSILLGAGIGLLSSAFSKKRGGGNSAPPDPMTPVGIRQYAEGTPNTSGIPAVLHDNEAVIPLTKGRKVPVEMNGDTATGKGGYVYAPTFNVTTPDADSFRRSQSQLLNDTAAAGEQARRKNG